MMNWVFLVLSSFIALDNGKNQDGNFRGIPWISLDHYKGKNAIIGFLRVKLQWFYTQKTSWIHQHQSIQNQTKTKKKREKVQNSRQSNFLRHLENKKRRKKKTPSFWGSRTHPIAAPIPWPTSFWAVGLPPVCRGSVGYGAPWWYLCWKKVKDPLDVHLLVELHFLAKSNEKIQRWILPCQLHAFSACTVECHQMWQLNISHFRMIVPLKPPFISIYRESSFSTCDYQMVNVDFPSCDENGWYDLVCHIP